MLSRLFIIPAINLVIWLRNRWRRRRVDYVFIEVSGSMPEFVQTPPLLQRLMRVPLADSLSTLRQQFRHIAADPNVSGVLLLLRDCSPGWATANSLRDELHALRSQGKRVVVYLPGADTRTYFVACAADEVLMPETAYLNLIGLLNEVVFLHDALTMIGVEAEVTAVSAYKSAAEPLTRSDLSPENREQLERLLDQRYHSLVAAIAQDRHLTPEQVRELIDAAPYKAGVAQQHGLIDGVCYEDELEARLLQHRNAPDAGKRKRRANNETKEHPLVVLRWNDAVRKLRIPFVTYRRKHVAVIPIQGMITSGRNRSLPLPRATQAGSDSLIRVLRRTERDERIAAVVLYIDSPGGDAFASDLIWREVLRLRQKKPVVVSMGNVAASGGYYVAASANAIIVQPDTITGSIGVLALRPVATRLFERIGINATILQRGARARLLTATQPPTDDDREVFRQMIFDLYADFKQRVCDGRGMREEQLEPLAGGRVWTGSEAVELGLADALGGLPTAVAKARELANLPAEPSAPVRWATPGKRRDQPLPPAFPAPQDNPAALLSLFTGLLAEVRRPRILAVLPWLEVDPKDTL